ncbi:MAG: NFACT RNA binding domain-containing protein [Treponema sp.]|jgi:predicted ribosome quality control (RQC) complex YloA/Tae2 family protein|nr:NFACT RNA binding domain-containing protein [Treponema sp.]
MSLNWKEINLILSELDLGGAQIQKAVQSSYEVLVLHVRNRARTVPVLVSLGAGACRIHETFRTAPKSEKPLRFGEFLKSRIVNSRIEEAAQLGENRIIRLVLRRGCLRYRMYIRLWSNAANVIVTDGEGLILDAMRRLPGRGEISGGRYTPEAAAETRSTREYAVRDFPDTASGASFNEKVDAWYAAHGGSLSLEPLREQVRKTLEGSRGRLAASLERLREKEGAYSAADRNREYGDIILSRSAGIKAASEWLETEDFEGRPLRIKIDGTKSPVQNAEQYYERYRKAKSGLEEVRREIAAGEAEFRRLEALEQRLLEENNPLILERLLKKVRRGADPDADLPRGAARPAKKRPGLAFHNGDWLILVGRDAKENDELLRRHVKGNDLWLHARDYSGSYVFIKQRAGKSVPLDILLDAGNLALFYSKGRNNREADLYYTPVKYLRRAKNGPKGLVIPTQEKNLHIKLDDRRLERLARI